MIVGAAVLAAAVLIPSAEARPNNPPRGTTARGGLVGQRAPAVNAARVAGSDPVGLQQLRGRVVILDFWATYCGPCRMVMPLLDGMHRQYHDQGLTVLGISNEPRPLIERHLRAEPVDYTIARDMGGTGVRFRVRAIPTLVVIDRQGEVREVMAGINAARMQQLAQLVPQLLAEPAP